MDTNYLELVIKEECWLATAFADLRSVVGSAILKVDVDDEQQVDQMFQVIESEDPVVILGRLSVQV